ncbi:hypothetical protein MKW94_015425 [Papaver nudicaule]|uniref:Uncharacterized protein n=1 Tax=Papaver nudicaule TaxID=74823 RepID=A0AA41S423_PAPNU|nr:hypothetical protein [Papaver nudicaule]
MGRPPCCDKTGVKKGPWTPEEDIALVSFIQEHGPGNWRAVPTNTGLLRCSKSCRLRWTNYLRPGIRRGNFTDHEEKMIIHLQALLGNRWAAIASYLPQRTDNDIKNYWNTHLRKKLRKLEAAAGHGNLPSDGILNSDQQPAVAKGQWERRLQTDMHTAKKALSDALSLDDKSSALPTSYASLLASSSSDLSSSAISHSDPYFVKANPPPPPTTATTTTYASSTENISRLLQGWMKNSPKSSTATTSSSSYIGVGTKTESATSSDVEGTSNSKSEGFDQSVFGFDSSNSNTTPQSMSTVDDQTTISSTDLYHDEKRSSNKELIMKSESEAAVPFSVIENWLFDESVVSQAQEEGLFQISLGCEDHHNTSEFF